MVQYRPSLLTRFFFSNVSVCRVLLNLKPELRFFITATTTYSTIYFNFFYWYTCNIIIYTKPTYSSLSLKKVIFLFFISLKSWKHVRLLCLAQKVWFLFIYHHHTQKTKKRKKMNVSILCYIQVFILYTS